MFEIRFPSDLMKTAEFLTESFPFWTGPELHQLGSLFPTPKHKHTYFNELYNRIKRSKTYKK